MRRRLVLRGLRWRLLLALFLTAAVTLAVVAAITLSPLRHRLRQQSADNLRTAVVEAAPTLGEYVHVHDRVLKISGPATDLNEKTDARVMITDTELTPFYDTETGPVNAQAILANGEAYRTQTTVTKFDGDDLTIATPLYTGGRETGVLVVQRRLSEVTTAVEQVRDALLAAAAVGLLVALVIGLALSSGLTRRLARLRAAALRITKEGPNAPTPPRDTRRDEVGDLARALARMQEELRRQEVARRSFVATASHELRTPLTMLQGTMELLEEDLRDGADIEDAQDQVVSARRELRRLSALAGELLDLSRLDAAVQLRSEPVELGEVARAVAAEFELRAVERGVRLETVHPPDPCWGRGDPDAIARVVRILIDNALRYGPPGEPVTVSAACTAKDACIAVADRGAGVPPEERERIFERFHRGRATGPEGGFGLGLAIGRELAERMGGSLQLGDSAPGARFVLTVPAASGSAPSPSRAPDSAAAA
ncbi:MAG TPA: HAMP domain-containing sensor histidine kinase [Solirubrobacteraceae bacterium]|jgi:signal transduction histidine kinase